MTVSPPAQRQAAPVSGADSTRTGVDRETLRHALGHFLTGVTVATTTGPTGEPVGMTANSFTSVSLEPPLVLLCVARSAASFAAMERARRYAVHILHHEQHEISTAFARSAATGAQKFDHVRWHRGDDGLPLLDDCLVRIECTITQRVALGDHVGYIGHVDAAGAHAGGTPLAFFQGSYGTLAL
jgi:flavin reductase (DIM6/NTAB) family NADH-FMN oxidoreductase RutF